MSSVVPRGDVAASGLFDRLGVFARDIKVSHSVFALPFGVLATFLAAAFDRRTPDPGTLVLIVLCMFLARTVAMAANRWMDGRLDAINPRTTGRAIPSGRLTGRFVLGVACVCSALFVAATGGFWALDANIYPLILSPLVLAWLVAYSFTKRVTWFCHVFLGGALALSPLAAAVAVEPAYLAKWEPYLLAVMVTCWVAGFDIIYALQDVASDRKTGVFSMPARLGAAPALWISRGLHVLAVVALVAVWQASPALEGAFALGIVIVSGLLLVEHALVWGSKTHQIHLAFLTVNGVISLVLGVLGVVDAVASVAG